MFWLAMTPITCGPYIQPFCVSSTGVLGTGHWRSGRPDFTQSNTFFNVPLSLTTTSSDFGGAPECARAHAGFADISMFLMVGLSPEKATLPVTVAAFASSMVAGAVAGAVASSFAALSGSFFPHPENVRIDTIPRQM